MARDPVFDRQVFLMLRGAEQEVQKLFVQHIHQELDRAKAEARPAGWDQWIDGKEGAPIESVSTFGVAVFEFRYMPEIICFALDILFANSPIDMHPRADNIVFREFRQLFIDGVFRDDVSDGMEPTDFRWMLDLPKGTEYLLTDDESYAGKLEKGYSDQAPNGVYKVSCDTVRRKFGNLVEVEFQWSRAEQGRRGGAPAMMIRER
ncbi:hypothetical protein [Azospirillum argentinense]